MITQRTQPRDVRAAWKWHCVYCLADGSFTWITIWASDLEEAGQQAHDRQPPDMRSLVVELDEVGPFPQYKHP